MTKLNESLTDVAYHFTTLDNALNILLTKRFNLSNAKFSKSENIFSPKEYPYFLSATRSKVGEYHSGNVRGVVFVLDGRWFNSRYPSKPIDYWERSWNYPKSKTHSESEDRIFSKEPHIPIDGVTEIHVLIKPDNGDINAERARQILILSKTNNIATYLYNDPKAWQLQNKSKAIPISKDLQLLKGHKKEPAYFSKSSLDRNDLINLIELIAKPNTSTPSKDTAPLLRKILRYPNDAVKSIETDLFNARKPTAREYPVANKITQYLSHQKLTLTELMSILQQKWKPQ